jgi:hypothetical protein
MNKIQLLIILSFFVPTSFIAVYGQPFGIQVNTTNNLNNPTSPDLFKDVVDMYENGVKFKEVLAVAIGILAFSFFIWKTAKFLSKREPINLKRISSISVENLSERKRIVLYVTKYVLIFPITMYCWVVVCFFFMYTLNTSLSFGVLTLMMVGIITASRIAAHFNESLAEDIMKFLPFNLLFTLLYNPYLDYNKIVSSIQHFPLIMLELTIFIGFVALLELILKIAYFAVKKTRPYSNKP